MKKEDVYYQAMRARDARFDGKFFVGVKTTGIYCRPICPAKPKRENVEFFSSHLAAESAGYRPCLRCRPESAPRSAAWIGSSAVVQRAVKVLRRLESLEFNEDEFAELFGVTARHLRRLFIREIGKTPKQIAFEMRLDLARKLLVETSLPISEIAFASGFASLRRFNDAFRERFKKPPREIRRSRKKGGEGLRVRMAYRPPFDFEGLLNSYRSHQVGDLEWFEDGKMFRLIEFEGKIGTLEISDDPEKSELVVGIDFPDSTFLLAILSRVRAMFDLDSDPVIVANALEGVSGLRRLLKLHPGIRLPSGWDPFEISIATILGQLVSLERGRALVRDLIEIAGRESGLFRNGKPVKLFPTPRNILEADLSGLKTTGVRKKAMVEFAKAVHESRISLEPTQDVEEFTGQILALPGIGPWTAHYIALKALRSTDSFPASDLILARALEIHPEIEAARPWRAYVAALFWRAYAGKLNKRREK